MTLTPTHEPPSDATLREVALTRGEYHFAADLLDPSAQRGGAWNHRRHVERALRLQALLVRS